MKPFLEKFDRYTPSTKDEETVLSHITDYSVAADVEQRMIRVKAHFDTYVHFSRLEPVETHIAEAYSLNYMSITPSFTDEPFSVAHMDHVLYELCRLTAAGRGFFDGAETALEGADVRTEGDTLVISLKHGGKNLLVAGGCDKLISDVIRELFGACVKVEFDGVTVVTEREYDYAPLAYVPPEEPESETPDANPL